MSEPLDELYLTWLYSQVSSVKSKQLSKTYWSLFRELYRTEFVWFVPNDDNRVEDGRDLRYEFMHDHDIDYNDEEWQSLGCSMLEMLIGLSRRLAFQAEGEPRAWFWHLLANLGLDKMNDIYCRRSTYKEEIEDIVSRVIWRTYDYYGRGGLFPLRKAAEDQRKLEIWYQLNAYVIENTS